MSFLESLVVYILTLLKITYELGLSLLILIALMCIATILKGDKYLFTKLYKKMWRYIYGNNFKYYK